MYFAEEEAQVVRAFLACIAEDGITNMTVDHLARRLCSSRAGLYRIFGSWPQMILFGYEAMLEWIDEQTPQAGTDRRAELERWWSALSRLFASPDGRGVLAMRALACVHAGADRVDALELDRLRLLQRWCAASSAATRATWALVRTTALASTEAERLELREIVWLLIGRERDTAPDLDGFLALEPPM